MRIIFFNRFFFPDTSATSQILSDLAFFLAECGHEVHVIATGAGCMKAEETVLGVRVHRVAQAGPKSDGLVQRAAAYGSYMLGAFRQSRKLITAGDIAVLKTDPPVLGPLMARRLKSNGASVVLWLQDLFPEVAKAYGVPGVNGFAYRALSRYRSRALDSAAAVVPISEAMARLMPPGTRTNVIHNWADGRAIRPEDPVGNELRAQWNLREKLVIGYSGNFGRVHEFETILDAAKRLRDVNNVAFVLIGRGPRLEDTRERVARESIDNVRFEEHQPRSRLADALSLPDIHLVTLRPEFEGLVFPSKLYGVMAAGRPTIFVGDVNGSVAEVLRQTDSGIAVRVGDPDALVSAILHLRANPVERLRLGKNARAAFEARFDKVIALEKWKQLLESLHS